MSARVLVRGSVVIIAALCLLLSVCVAIMGARRPCVTSAWIYHSGVNDVGFSIQTAGRWVTVSIVYETLRPDALNVDLASAAWSTRTRSPFVWAESRLVAIGAEELQIRSRKTLSEFGIQRRTIQATLPTWCLVFGLSAPAIGRVFSANRRWRRRRHRLAAGLCLACGYDLRESSSRCPECGTLISAPRP